MEQLFTHILVPVDFTGKNAVAMRIARRLARQNESRLTLLHVVESIDQSANGDFDTFYAQLKERSHKQLNDMAAQLDGRLAVEHETLLGKPATEIVRYAMQNKVDLLIMNSHAIYPDQEKGWGTLSYRVSILCQCPVLLVK